MWSCHYSYRAQRLHPACLMFLTGPDWSRPAVTDQFVCLQMMKARWDELQQLQPSHQLGPETQPDLQLRHNAPELQQGHLQPQHALVLQDQQWCGLSQPWDNPQSVLHHHHSHTVSQHQWELQWVPLSQQQQPQPKVTYNPLLSLGLKHTWYIHISKWTPTYHHGGYLDAKGAKI